MSTLEERRRLREEQRKREVEEVTKAAQKKEEEEKFLRDLEARRKQREEARRKEALALKREENFSVVVESSGDTLIGGGKNELNVSEIVVGASGSVKGLTSNAPQTDFGNNQRRPQPKGAVPKGAIPKGPLIENHAIASGAVKVARSTEPHQTDFRSQALKRKTVQLVGLSRLQKSKLEADIKATQDIEGKAKRDVDARLKQEADLKAKRDAEARAKQEADLKAKRDAEAKSKQEADLNAKRDPVPRSKQEADLKAKRDADARLKQEADMKAKRDAETRAKQEINLKAKRDAEARSKQDFDPIAKRDVEPKSGQDTELKAKREAEAKAKLLNRRSVADRWKPQTQTATNSTAKEEVERMRSRSEFERKASLASLSPQPNLASSSEFSDKDITIFLQYINSVLAGEARVNHLIPLSTNEANLSKTFTDLSDGMVLCKFMDKLIPDMLDERAINYKIFDKQSKIENWNLCVNTGRACGCRLSDVSVNDLEAGKKEAIVKVIWETIRAQFDYKLKSSKKFNSQLESIVDQRSGEQVDNVKRLPVDQIVLRWVNFQLAKAGLGRKATNISEDFKDSELYIVLFNAIAPSLADKSALKIDDLKKRAEKVVEICKKFKFPNIIFPEAILEGTYWINLVILGTLLTSFQVN
eukprot:TRINITY_DN4581_c0_g3_i5.p1 TRINITY_DN4581_c0_g3~~TRINITY_DN4581_c0_g3_i5.p1  ORF type:complete len:658 (+),score=189.58 TRINITY_DN4581_c0_g3_i5:44-1975(+)